MSNKVGRWFARLSEGSVKQLFHRFFLSSFQVVVLVVLLWVSLYDEYNLWGERWWNVAVYYLPSGAVLSWGLQMFAERRGGRGWLIALLVQFLWLGNAIYLYFIPELSLPVVLANVSMLSFILVASFIAPSLGTKTELSTWNYTLRTLATIVISALIALFLAGGVSLLLLMLETLFNMYIGEDTYRGLWASVPILTFAYLFLCQQPRDEEIIDEEVHTLAILNIFARYLLAPLLTIYLVVLYLYALRILNVWELPNGWVSYPIAALLGGTILLVALLYPARQESEPRPIDEFICRWLPLAILPLLVLMSVGLAKRWSDYGMTVMRLYLLAANLWCYFACVYLFLYRSQRLRLLPLSLSIIFVLTSVGPWSFSSITYRYMRDTIDKILAEAKQKPKLPMSDVDIETFVASLGEEERKEFVSKLAYLDENYPEEWIQDVVQESVYVCGVSDTASYAVFENEIWSVEESERFMPLPKDFETFMPADLYVEWKGGELGVPTTDHSDVDAKPNIKTSFQELQDWTTVTSPSPHLFRTTDPNIFFHATSASLFVTRDESGQISELSGNISGIYLRK